MMTSFRLWPAQDVPLSIFIKEASLKHVKVVLSSKIFSRSSFKMSHNSKVPTQTLSLKTWPAACRCTTPALVQLSLIYPWAVNATISTDSRNLLVFKLKRTDLSLLSNLLCVSTFNQFIDIWIHQSNPFRHVSYIRTRCGSFYFEECLWIIEQCSSLGTWRDHHFVFAFCGQ